MPDTCLIWPESICLASSALAASKSSAVKSAGFLPWASMITPIVSRISESTDTRPLSLGSHSCSSDVSESLPIASLSSGTFQPRPAKPLCHGRVLLRPGSKGTSARAGKTLALFGIAPAAKDSV